MRKALQFLVGLGLVAGTMAFAADGVKVLVENGYEGVDVTGTIDLVGMYIDSVYIDIDTSTPTTQIVTIATSDETILTATDVIVDAAYRPRIAVCGVAGAALGGTTNDYERFFVFNDTVTVTVNASQTTTNDVSIYFRLIPRN